MRDVGGWTWSLSTAFRVCSILYRHYWSWTWQAFELQWQSEGEHWRRTRFALFWLSSLCVSCPVHPVWTFFNLRSQIRFCPVPSCSFDMDPIYVKYCNWFGVFFFFRIVFIDINKILKMKMVQSHSRVAHVVGAVSLCKILVLDSSHRSTK